MKFSCEKSTLLDAINISSRAVSGKSAMALLEGLLLRAGDRLTLTGYDLTLGIRTTIDADVIEPGEVVLGARILGDIIRKLPDDVVYLETDDKLLTTIKCGRSVFNIIASPADDFPQLPEVLQESSISLPENTLKRAISQTIFAVSDNESKPIHTGELFEVSGNNLNIVAVDGYRVSIRRETLDAPVLEPMKFVVPGSALRELERILDDSDGSIAIYPDEKHILFSVGDTELITRLIDGEFLNYRAAIPNDADYRIQAETRALITAVERVSLITTEKLKNPVRLDFDGDILKLSCITAIGKSYDECTFDGEISNLEIGFNNRYLLDALRACNENDKIALAFKGALNPLVITPLEGDRFTYLVLPVRLKAND